MGDSKEKNEAKFLKNFAQKKKEIASAMKNADKENPEEVEEEVDEQGKEKKKKAKEVPVIDEDANLSFRERLMQKSSLAKEFLSSLKSTNEKTRKK